jgi:hypothetical protein
MSYTVSSHEVVTDCDHLARLRFSPVLPYAFSEYGAIMLASVLNSQTAIEASLQIVRTFVRLREILSAHAEFSRRLDELEKRHDQQFTQVFTVLRELLEAPKAPAPPERKKIGFGEG